MSESILEECVIEETSDEFKYLLNVGEEGLPGDFIFEEVISPVENQTDCNIAITDVCSLSGDKLGVDKSKNVKSKPEKPARVQEQNQIVLKRDQIVLEQDQIVLDRDQIILDQDQIVQEKDRILQEQDQILHEQDPIVLEQDEIVLEQDEIVLEQDEIVLEQNQIVLEQDQFVQEKDPVVKENDQFVEVKDQFVQEQAFQIKQEQGQIVPEQGQIVPEQVQIKQEQGQIVQEQDHIEQEQEQIVQVQGQIEQSPSKNREVNEEADHMEEDGLIHSDPLLSCSDIEFKITYRISRSSFEKILLILSKEKLDEIENVPLYKRLLIFLWLMGSFTSFSDAAETLKVTEDEASDSFYSVCSALSNKTDSFVQWPDSDEREQISSRVESNYGIDGVVGILAVHYCPLYIPKESAMRRSYFNVSMKLYCVALQLVVDDKFFIRDVFAGQPGSFRQDVVMRQSPLASQLSCTPCTLVENHRHVLARAGLPQLQTTLTPLVGSNLSPAEIRLNQQIESACCLADEVYQTLRLRFSILTLLDINEAIGILQAACVLHNACLANGDFFQS